MFNERGGGLDSSFFDSQVLGLFPSTSILTVVVRNVLVGVVAIPVYGSFSGFFRLVRSIFLKSFALGGPRTRWAVFEIHKRDAGHPFIFAKGSTFQTRRGMSLVCGHTSFIFAKLFTLSATISIGRNSSVSLLDPKILSRGLSL